MIGDTQLVNVND